jgi:hypothetical protein
MHFLVSSVVPILTWMNAITLMGATINATTSEELTQTSMMTDQLVYCEIRKRDSDQEDSPLELPVDDTARELVVIDEHFHAGYLSKEVKRESHCRREAEVVGSLWRFLGPSCHLTGKYQVLVLLSGKPTDSAVVIGLSFLKVETGGSALWAPRLWDCSEAFQLRLACSKILPTMHQLP